MTDDGDFRRKAVAKWIADQGLRDPNTVTEAEFAELRSLLAPHKGFGIFLSIMMHHRQLTTIAMLNTRLGTPEADALASRYQGTILAIDAMRDLVLDIADPIGERSEA